MPLAIKINGLSKIYRLGQIGTGTISRDIDRWFKMRIRGKEDPYLIIGETNERSVKGVSDVVYSLRDVNFNVQQGDALGIIGKNGAGKSTLLKIISRVTSPTTGKISIKGRVASLLEIGTGFHPELTGRENIFLNGAILGMRKKEITSKLDEIIDFSGVERYIDTPVKRYSSGMYVRLAFAVAAHLESEILIVDEVLAVGDAEFQKKCLGKMGEVSKGEGRTVLFVSHNMGAIKTLCTKGMYLKNGEVSFEGNSEETITEYLSDSSGQIGIPIENRTDRIGNGRIKVKNIIFRNKSNVPTSEIMAGDYLRIEFEIDKDPEIKLKEMIVACGFSDTYENTMIVWVSDEMKQDFEFINGNNFALEIPHFNLRPNTYQFGYQISYRDTAPQSFCDVLRSACSINVLASDFFGSGRNIRQGTSLLLKADFKNKMDV
jgi:lipopolysaccharide transport system ATP-binding protein